MKVLSRAVALGLSTPLVVLACGSTESGNSPHDGTAGDAGAKASAGSSGVGGSSLAGTSAGGAPTGGDAGRGGVTAAAGTANAGGVAAHGPSSLTPAQGFPSDLTIGAWDSKPGLDVIVANSRGLSYFSNDGAGRFRTDDYVGTVADVVAAGQLDSGTALDVLTGEFTSTAIFTSFGDGAGGVVTSEKQFFGAEGVGANFFVADVDGSGPSQDFVVTCTGTVSVVVTTGMQGAGFLDAYAAPGLDPGPQDGVLARLGSKQWLVYSAGDNIYRSLVTYSTAPSTVTVGTALAMPIGGTPAQLDVGDFNEDGFDDIAVTLTGSGDLNVLFGDGLGEGSFLPVVNADRFLTLTIGSGAADQTQRDVKVGDLNGDGHADIAVSVQGLDAIAIFSGDGTGAFTGPQLVSTGAGSGPTRLALGQLNGDKLDDLAVVGATSKKVIVLLSEPATSN